MIETPKKRRVWPFVAIVAGLIFVIWLTLLPRQLKNHSLDFNLSGLKNSITDLSGIEAIKTSAQDVFEQLNEEEDNGTSLTDEEIRDLERRVFDDPQ